MKKVLLALALLPMLAIGQLQTPIAFHNLPVITTVHSSDLVMLDQSAFFPFPTNLTPTPGVATVSQLLSGITGLGPAPDGTNTVLYNSLAGIVETPGIIVNDAGATITIGSATTPYIVQGNTGPTGQVLVISGGPGSTGNGGILRLNGGAGAAGSATNGGNVVLNGGLGGAGGKTGIIRTGALFMLNDPLAPTIGGAGCSFGGGNNNKGAVTATGADVCTVTFNTSTTGWVTFNPICVVSGYSATVLPYISTVPTTVFFTINTAGAGTVSYICL